jgi:hypothetical protein
MKRNHLALCELLEIHSPETANLLHFDVRAYEHAGDRNTWFVDSSQRVRKPFNGGSPIFFVATSRYELSLRGGVFGLQHCFQLDLAQLDICIDKLCGDSHWAAKLKEPVNMATIFTEAYSLLQSHLIDFNEDQDDYQAIAKLLFDLRVIPISGVFGM